MDFDEIILQIIEEIASDNTPDIEQYCKQYPEHREAILSKFRTFQFIKSNLADNELTEKQLGEYFILREIGRGGMGIVFLAMHPDLSRLTAIKVLPPSFSFDTNVLNNFKQEAKAIAKFNHPNIVPIYSISRDNGIYYIAMGYIPGMSLKELIIGIKNIDILITSNVRELFLKHASTKKTSERESITKQRSSEFWKKSYFDFVATIGAEIASALEYAHQNGICHGDIKPSNILFTREATPMLVDFGLSRDSETLKDNPDDDFSGTLPYAAPEHIQKNIIDEKTDSWALGVTLYEWLTFKNPFREKTVKQTVNAILKKPPLPLRHYNKKIPVELEAIVLKCLENNVGNRYNSTKLKNDLLAYIESRPIKARPINIFQHIVKIAKRKPLIASLLVAILILFMPVSFSLYYVNLDKIVAQGKQMQGSSFSQKAENYYKKALKLCYELPFLDKIRERALIGLGELNVEVDDHSSITYLKKALKINPDSFLALLNLALTYERLEQYDNAKKCYERILDNNPWHVMALRGYGALVRKLGNPDKALNFYSNALKTDKERKGEGNSLVYLDATWAISDIIKQSQSTAFVINSYSQIKKLLLSKGFNKSDIETITEEHKKWYPAFEIKDLTHHTLKDGCLTYVDPLNLYGLNYPLSWEVNFQFPHVSFLSPAEGQKDPFRENVVVTMAKVPDFYIRDTVKLNKYVDWRIEEAAKKLENPNLVERGKIELDDKNAEYIVFEYSIGQVVFKNKAYIMICPFSTAVKPLYDHGGINLTELDYIAYTLLYTAEKSQYNQYLEQAEYIMTTMRTEQRTKRISK